MPKWNKKAQQRVAESGPIGRIIGKILGFLGVILIIVIVSLLLFVGYRYISVKQERGEVASAIVHGEVAAEKKLSPLAAATKKVSPDLCTALFPSDCPYNPYAIDAVVEESVKRDIGVKITKFRPVAEFFRPNTKITLLGEIVAEGLGDKPVEIETYCSLEGFKDEELIPALLTGLNVEGGNRGIVEEDQRAIFQVQCTFPGLAVEKQVTSKKAHLVVVYDFTTKAYQRVWFLKQQALAALQSQDPFEFYGVNDNLMDSERKVKPVTTPGPEELGLDIGPQPLTENTDYLLLLKLSRSFNIGTLEKLNYLKIKVPAVPQLEVALAGEENLLGTPQCDFEYIGLAEELGYKEYQLVSTKLDEVNQECNKKSLKELALSEQACIEYYKEQLFLCNFVVLKAPSQLSSDTIRAEANYVYKVEDQTVVDIRALPSELIT